MKHFSEGNVEYDDTPIGGFHQDDYYSQDDYYYESSMMRRDDDPDPMADYENNIKHFDE